MRDNAEIAIIGGSGLYDQELLEDSKEIKVYTPYGRTSDLITIGNYMGRNVAFLPRHGRGHQIPPHAINYRANIWALRSLGVKRILSSNACGSLQERYKPGDILVLNQFIDRTKLRPSTFYDGGKVCHISSADPFCPELGRLLVQEGLSLGLSIHDGGTYVCIEGPRFSTRAESNLFRQWGADVVGMTVFPECVLAREAEICYGSIALVTDYDVWAAKPVSVDEVVRVMKANVDKAKKLFAAVIPKIPDRAECGCWSALKEALI
ncbi:MAG: S-methyl-5'-thioadenosine phosphorylase [Candidatus Bathyarchaeia archaeon]